MDADAETARTDPALVAVPPVPCRLPAIDAVRVITVLTVVAVHALSVAIPEDDRVAGAALTVFHSSREVFLLLSAVVLTHTAGRHVAPVRFWRRRAPLVLAPYALWSVIYLLADGHFGPPASFARHLAIDLASGGARYHLYFVLLTLQLYLVFPWLLAWVRRFAARPAPLLIASATAQLAFTAVAHYRLAVPPPLSWLSQHPGSWLPSYQLYIIAGVVVGLQAEAVASWCDRHLTVLLCLAASSVAVAVIGYLAEVWGQGSGPVHASEVFQPAVVAESMAIAAAELGVAARLTGRAGPGGLRRLARWSDLSFGIYLLHPLLLQVILADTALPSALASLTPAAATAMAVGVVAPLLVVASGALVSVARASPFSLYLCGRRPRRRAGALAGVASTPAPLASATVAVGTA